MSSLWNRFQEFQVRHAALGLSLDISRMRFGDDFFAKHEAAAQEAFAAMKELEAGGIANPDEHRMVGHFWLRAPKLAPKPELTAEIEEANAAIMKFAQGVQV